jgi:hypothetical protein
VEHETIPGQAPISYVPCPLYLSLTPDAVYYQASETLGNDYCFTPRYSVDRPIYSRDLTDDTVGPEETLPMSDAFANIASGAWMMTNWMRVYYRGEETAHLEEKQSSRSFHPWETLMSGPWAVVGSSDDPYALQQLIHLGQTGDGWTLSEGFDQIGLFGSRLLLTESTEVTEGEIPTRTGRYAVGDPVTGEWWEIQLPGGSDERAEDGAPIDIGIWGNRVHWITEDDSGAVPQFAFHTWDYVAGHESSIPLSMDSSVTSLSIQSISDGSALLRSLTPSFEEAFYAIDTDDPATMIDLGPFTPAADRTSSNLGHAHAGDLIALRDSSLNSPDHFAVKIVQLPFGGESPALLLGAIGDDEVVSDISHIALTLDFTEPLAEGELSITDGYGDIVATIPTPASPDGSLRDITIDDVWLGSGVYTWTLTAPGSDGQMARALDGIGSPSGSFTIA